MNAAKKTIITTVVLRDCDVAQLQCCLVETSAHSIMRGVLGGNRGGQDSPSAWKRRSTVLDYEYNKKQFYPVCDHGPHGGNEMGTTSTDGWAISQLASPLCPLRTIDSPGAPIHSYRNSWRVVTNQWMNSSAVATQRKVTGHFSWFRINVAKENNSRECSFSSVCRNLVVLPVYSISCFTQ